MQGGVATAAAAETVTAPLCNGGPAPPQFLLKTYVMVNDPATDNVVSWGPEKKSIIVSNMDEFARDVLPNYFPRSNFSSFVRELNTYLDGNPIRVYTASPPQSKLPRTVFVGNLNLQTKRMVLKNEFAAFGEIELVRIVGHMHMRSKRKTLTKDFPALGEIKSVMIRSPLVNTMVTRQGTIIPGTINELIANVHAYIVFKEEWSARAALSQNMALFEGTHIRVDILRGGGPVNKNKRTVFVGNLPYDVKDEELYQLFCGSSGSEGNVEAIRVIRDPNSNLGKGIAYVLFKTMEAANSIVRKHDMKIRDHPLRLAPAEPVDATPNIKQSESNEAGSSYGKLKRPAVAARKAAHLAKKLKLDV